MQQVDKVWNHCEGLESLNVCDSASTIAGKLNTILADLLLPVANLYSPLYASFRAVSGLQPYAHFRNMLSLFFTYLPST